MSSSYSEKAIKIMKYFDINLETQIRIKKNVDSAQPQSYKQILQ